VSSRTGKLTPIEVLTNPLAMLIAGWRSKADTVCASPIETPFAVARATAYRECANDLERALSSVRAIIRV
jgi:hypothetical protein